MSARDFPSPTEQPAPRSVRFGLALFLIAIIGWFDYATGYEIRVYPLYFIAIGLGAWRGGERKAFALAVLSTTAWLVSNRLVGRQYSNPAVWWINSVSQFVAFVVIGVLVARLRRALDIERRLSRTDPLTGLLNSRAFYDAACAEIDRTGRNGLALTLAYVDLDNFKTVNDRFGHDVGDELLRRVADVFRGSLRRTDIAARLGGDEFALLLAQTDEQGARVILERIRAELAALVASRGWPVSLSVGAAAFTTPPESVDRLIQRADALMYQAKKQGKDRIVCETVE